ncbi:acyl-CoA dehydrogenase family protein [Bacillaceae bacterium S4-13-58]
MLRTVKGGSFLVDKTSPNDAFFPEDLTDEHLMIKSTAKKFVENEVLAAQEQIENQDFDTVVGLLRKAGDLGLLAHSIPEAYGGLGLDKISKGIVGEQVGGSGSYGVAHSNHTCIATLPITYYGTPEQKSKYLPKLASGEYIGAYCLTEPDAGSDAMSGKTTATLNETGTHYLLNGTKIYITNAIFSDTFIVYAKVDGQHFTAFIVEKDFPGLNLGPEENKMGIKGSSTRSVIFEDCQVPVENVLGDIGKGHLIAFTVLNLGRFNLGFACTGGAKRTLTMTIDHTLQRKQFNQPIANFRASKEKIAKMAARIFASESLHYRTAGLLEEALKGLDGEEDRRKVVAGMSEFALECAACKVYGSETLDYVADESVQLFGGAGFIKDYGVERVYRDSRINRIFEGTNEINRLLLTGQFLKKSLKGELAYERPLMVARERLRREIFHGDLSLEEKVEDIRALYLVLVDAARDKYGLAIENEQEVLMKLSDMAIHLYAAESAVLRLNKLDSSNRDFKYKELLAQTVVEESYSAVSGLVRPLLPDLFELDDPMGDRILKALDGRRFTGGIARNRKIAEMVYERGEY